jgi:uncharacterized membrane protein
VTTRTASLTILAAAFAVTLWVSPWDAEQVTDLPIYAAYAQLFLDGSFPYRDVAFEYPPLAAPLLALAGVAGTDYDTYRYAFALLAFLLAAAALLLCGRIAGRTGGSPPRAMFAIALAPLLTGAMIRTHFDLFPVVLVLAGLALLVDDRPRAGLAVLGMGIVAKGFPLVVVPVALAWLVARGERRAAIDGALACGVAVAGVVLAAVALSASGAWDAVAYHLDRPPQIESMPASLLLAFDALGAGTADVVTSFKSEGVLHPAGDAVVIVLSGLLIAVVAALAFTAAARRDEPDDRRALVICSLAAIAAFAVLGKVLSPQFLIWVVPLGALALAWRLHALAAAVALALLLTQIEFPTRYGDVAAREAGALWLVAARNAALAAVIYLAWRAVRSRPARAAGSARSQSPGHPGPPRPAPR